MGAQLLEFSFNIYYISGIMDIRVIIADDHAIIREGLKTLMENMDIQVMGTAASGREAVEMAIRLKPDIAVMDISMPGLNGIEATRQIRKHRLDTKIIALSVHSARRFIDDMFCAGASAYLLKERSFKELFTAVKEVNMGNYYISPAIARTYADFCSVDSTNHCVPGVRQMTEKEREVLQLIAEGAATKEMAADLNVSVKTIETHRRNIMKKLHIFSIAGLTKYAIREGIVSLE